MSKLLDYINHLDKNADARTAHAADPAGCMTNFGLGKDEQDAILSGDRQKLAGALGMQIHELPTLHIPQGTF